MYISLSNWRHDTALPAEQPQPARKSYTNTGYSDPPQPAFSATFILTEDASEDSPIIVSEYEALLITQDSYIPVEDTVFTGGGGGSSTSPANVGAHRIQSGPARQGYVVVTFPDEEPSLNPIEFIPEDAEPGTVSFSTELTIPFVDEDSDLITYSGTTGTSPYNRYKGLYFGVNDVGPDEGVKTPGPPFLYDSLLFGLENGDILGLEDYSELALYPLWGITTAWRQVPPAPAGFWTNYENVDYDPINALSSYEGYRGLTTTRIANAKVSSASGPQYGRRTTGAYTYYNGVAPASQPYTPYNTPDSNTSAQGYTGGGVTHGRLEGGILTNPTNDTSGSRASWVYNPPVYCKTFTETIRSASPGLMGPALRYVYRGKAGSYVSNFGSIYHQAPEGVRVMSRTFSSTVNSSNQK